MNEGTCEQTDGWTYEGTIIVVIVNIIVF